MIGQIISHYRILEKLGSGGMGLVYRAEDIRLHRFVALKFLPDNLVNDRRVMQRFEREARSASSLNHPNICTIYGVEEHDHQPVIVMELLEGVTLKSRIQQKNVGVPELVEFGIQISAALEAAHAKGIIHRDIKPANLFVVEGDRIKILDFGLAKTMRSEAVNEEDDDSSLTMDGVIPGTTAYMSPEQVRGEEIDGRSDLFSLGVVLFEMAVGKRPFSGKNRIVLMDAILNAKPAAPSRENAAIPAELDGIVLRCLEKDRERRYQRGADVSSDLKRLRTTTESGVSGTIAQTEVKRRSRVGWVWGISGAVCLTIIIIAGIIFWRSHRAKPLSEKDTIIVADFTNSTGDPVFDETLRQGLAIQLEQSPFLSMVSEERIQQVLHLMGRPGDEKLTPEVGRELCERTASTALLYGSIASLGSQYVLGVRAKNCRSGELIAEEQVQAAKKEDVLKALSQIASRLRTRMGESVSTLKEHNTPLEDATTPSLEALKAYSAGINLVATSSLAASIPLLQLAVEIDPNFAMAFAQLGLSYSDIGESVLGAENTTKAYRLRNHASDRERFFITSLYYRQVTGNLEKAHEALESWAETYPRERDAHGLLSGFVCQGTGRYEQSIQEGRKTIALDPDFVFGYLNLAYSSFYLDRFDDAERILQRASERNLEVPELLLLRYYLAFQKGDARGMEQEADRAKDKVGEEDWISHSESLILARSGKLSEARLMSAHATELANKAGQLERAASFEAATGVWNAFFGNRAEARRNALLALRGSQGRDVQYAVALALALSGESSRSEVLANDLERRFPEDTSVRYNYLPVLRAVFALNRRDPGKALDTLQPAVPYELAVPAIDFNFFYGGLYPVYVRGIAYLAGGQSGRAAVEFQKIIDHRGIVAGDPVGALAYLQLGRAYGMAGERTKARVAYERFLMLFKDADPNIPLLKEAKAEYAKLE